MKYILYLFTLALVFACGMMVGHLYLPDQTNSLAKAVSAPDLSSTNPIFKSISRERIVTNINSLNQALATCQVAVPQESENIVKEVELQLALEDFKLKKALLELEMAKNEKQNRTTSQFVQATTNYTQAKTYVEKLADEFFPVATTATENSTQKGTSPLSEEVPTNVKENNKN